MGAAQAAARTGDDGHAAAEVVGHEILVFGYGTAAGYTVSTDGGLGQPLERSVWQTLIPTAKEFP